MWLQVSEEQGEAILEALAEANAANRGSSNPDHPLDFYDQLADYIAEQSEDQDAAHIIYTIAQQHDQGDRKVFWDVTQITEQAELQYQHRRLAS